MFNRIKITEATNLAVHALAHLSNCEKGTPVSASVIARHLDVSEAHLAKVLQRLARHGFIRSVRGARGGVLLAKPPSVIRLLDVLEAIDGPISSESCFLGQPLCRPGACLFKDLTETVRGHLERTTIADYRRKRPGTKRSRS
jgi:Rrf2 family transcriptional regulator, nitric oxide-sensitive transcriptional repressor